MAPAGVWLTVSRLHLRADAAADVFPAEFRAAFSLCLHLIVRVTAYMAAWDWDKYAYESSARRAASQ